MAEAAVGAERQRSSLSLRYTMGEGKWPGLRKFTRGFVRKLLINGRERERESSTEVRSSSGLAVVSGTRQFQVRAWVSLCSIGRCVRPTQFDLPLATAPREISSLPALYRESSIEILEAHYRQVFHSICVLSTTRSSLRFVCPDAVWPTEISERKGFIRDFIVRPLRKPMETYISALL